MVTKLSAVFGYHCFHGWFFYCLGVLMASRVTMVTSVRVVISVSVVTIVGMDTLLWFSWPAWLPRL